MVMGSVMCGSKYTSPWIVTRGSKILSKTEVGFMKKFVNDLAATDNGKYDGRIERRV
jgi:hypothetical protein